MPANTVIPYASYSYEKKLCWVLSKYSYLLRLQGLWSLGIPSHQSKMGHSCTSSSQFALPELQKGLFVFPALGVYDWPWMRRTERDLPTVLEIIARWCSEPQTQVQVHCFTGNLFQLATEKRCRRIKSETTLLPQIPPPSSSVHFLSSFSVQESCYRTRTCLWHLASKEELQTPLPEATLKQLITLS